MNKLDDYFTDTAVNDPDDLVTLDEAAVMVGRSVSTVRRWLKSGDIDGYREDPSDNNSRWRVSKAQLVLYAGTSGKDPANQHDPTVHKVEMQAVESSVKGTDAYLSMALELAEAKADARVAMAERDAMAREVELVRSQLVDAQAEVARLQKDAEGWRAEWYAAKTELSAERSTTWIDRLLGRRPAPRALPPVEGVEPVAEGE